MTEYKPGEVYEDIHQELWRVDTNGLMCVWVGDSLGWFQGAGAPPSEIEDLYGPLTLVSFGPSKKNDPINSPRHYTWLPQGIEVIDIIELFNLRVGNALKYIFRHEYKGNPTEDLRKAIWFLEREVKMREASGGDQ